MQKLIELLKKLEEEKYFGDLIISFKDGKPVHGKEIKSYKFD